MCFADSLTEFVMLRYGEIVKAAHAHVSTVRRAAVSAIRTARRAEIWKGPSAVLRTPLAPVDPVDLITIQKLSLRTRNWLQRELNTFLGTDTAAGDAIVLPAAGAHLAGDALAISDCDLVIVHGPSLNCATCWTGRQGFLEHLRAQPYVHGLRHVVFGSVDNIQCYVIAQLGDSSSDPSGIYIRVDISRINAAESLVRQPQSSRLARLLQYLESDDNYCMPLPNQKDLPSLADDESVKRLQR